MLTTNYLIYKLPEKKEETMSGNKIKQLLPNTFFPIRDYHFQYENIDYQVLGGMVIMNLTNN